MSALDPQNHLRMTPMTWPARCVFALAMILIAALNVRGGPRLDAASEAASGAADATGNAASHAPPISDSSLDNQFIGGHEASVSRDGQSSSSPSSPTPTLEAPRVIAALLLVIGLVFGLRWLSRRFLPGSVLARSSSAVQLLTRAAVTPKQQVLLLRVGRRVLVVADNGSQLSALGQITESDEVAALVGQVQSEVGASAARPFTSLFRRHSQQFEPTDEEVAATSATDADSSLAARDEDDASMQPTQISGPGDVGNVRAELSGLMERVRLVAREFGGRSSS